jgi:2-dehydro-3-deoxy-D-gluconate 5-dehydrogenase
MSTESIGQLFDLTGKAAIVTGGAQGIGQAIAFRLAEAGASVMITDINLEAANDTVKQIKAKGGTAKAIRADAASVADAKKVVQATVTAFGRLDILVNNAGIYPHTPTMELSEDMWDKVLDINLKGTFFYSQAAAQQMVEAKRGGKIINIGSVTSVHPNVGLAHYCSSKGGVLMLTKALALEFGPNNIQVNAVAPGGIVVAAVREKITFSEEFIQKRLQRVPLRRTGDPDDVAKTVLFLASPATDYMTGNLIAVDGGFLVS